MATCIRCGISGPFVRVNEAGICPLCQSRPEPKQTPKPGRKLPPEFDPEQVFLRYLTTYHTTYPTGYDVTTSYTSEFDCMLSSLPEHPVRRSQRDVVPEKPECVYCKDLKGIEFSECADFVAVDTETSGLTASAEIVEVSAIKFRNFRPVASFATLCRPYGRISPEATAVNGISSAHVKNAPRCAEILDGLENFIEGLPLVAHNATFDMKMLAREGMDTYARRVFDTLPIARKILRRPNGEKLPGYKLADACRACAVLFDGAHRSTADAFAAGLLFTELVKRHFGKENLLTSDFVGKS